MNGFLEETDANQRYIAGTEQCPSYGWKLLPRGGRTVSFTVEICLDHNRKTALSSIQTSADTIGRTLDARERAMSLPQNFVIILSSFCESIDWTCIGDLVDKPSKLIHSSTVFRAKRDLVSNFVQSMSPCDGYSLDQLYIHLPDLSGGQVVSFATSQWHMHEMRV